MLYPPSIIKFLKLCAYSVKIKGSTPSNRAYAAIATHNILTVQYARPYQRTDGRHRTSVGFKLAVALKQVVL